MSTATTTSTSHDTLPTHHEPVHNLTHQHPDNPTRTLGCPETPHHNGRRETLLHVAGRP